MQCPRCGGEMWDNRKNKKNPKAPDFKCKDENCQDDNGYVTAVWEKKEPHGEGVFQGRKPAKHESNGNGSLDMMKLAYRKDLMVALIGKYGETLSNVELKSFFNDLWSEVEK